MNVKQAIFWFCILIFLENSIGQGDESGNAETKSLSPEDRNPTNHLHLSSAADPLCGPNSLYVVCKLCNIGATLQELKALTRQDERGTTMLGLLQAAKAKGLHAKAIKCEFRVLKRYLERPRVYGIPHVNGDHFFVIYCVSGGYLSIIDVPKQPYEIGQKEFFEIWDGTVLLLSKSPLPNLVMRQYLHLTVLSLLAGFLIFMYFLRARRAKRERLKEEEPSV